MKLPAWLKKKQDVLIVAGLLVLMGVLVYIGMNMQKSYLRSNDAEGEKPPEKVRLRSPGKSQSAKDQAAQGQGQQGGSSSTTYFLAPTPAEVMSMVKEIVDSELPVPKERYENLRIVWPVYFFQIGEQDGEKATVEFDTSADGFGVNIVTEIDSLKYPEILSAEPYQKMWLAGVIEAIDAAGTGTIYMQAEHIRFEEELVEVQKAMEKMQAAENR